MYACLPRIAVCLLLFLVLWVCLPIRAAETVACDPATDRDVRSKVTYHAERFKTLDQAIHDYIRQFQQAEGAERWLFFYDASDKIAQFMEAADALRVERDGPFKTWIEQMLSCNRESAEQVKLKTDELLTEQRKLWRHLQQHLDAFAEPAFLQQVAEAQMQAQLLFGKEVVEPFRTAQRVFAMFAAQAERYTLNMNEFEALVDKEGLDGAIRILGLDTSRKAIEQALKAAEKKRADAGRCCALGELDEHKLARHVYLRYNLPEHSSLAVNMLLSDALADNVAEAIRSYKEAMFLFERSAGRQFAISDWDALTPPEGDSTKAVAARWALQQHFDMQRRYWLLVATTDPKKKQDWAESYKALML